MSNHAVIVVNPDLKIEQLVKQIINNSQRQLILEIPEKTNFLTNEINLRLIKFYAEDEDKELIINAVDPVLVSLAQRLGISTIRERNLDVTGQVEEAASTVLNEETEPLPVPVKKPKRQRRRKKKAPDWSYKGKGFLPAVVITLITLAIGVWYFLQPKALIIVYPKEQKINFSAKAVAGPDYIDHDILMGKIPAKIVEKVGELSIQTATSGQKLIGITPATGKVILINSSTQPVVVPQDSVVVGANGVRFKTAKNVLVPKKITRLRYGIPVGESYGKVEVPVTALQKGTIGNQPPKAINKIEGKYQKFLQVVNLVPTTKGTDRRIPVVDSADIKKGQTEATNQVHLMAPDELAALVGSGYLFLPELVEIKVLNLTSSPQEGTEAATVKTSLKYRASVVVPSNDGIHKYLVNQLEANLPPGFEKKNQEVKLVSTQVVHSQAEQINLHLIGTSTLRGILAPAKIKELIKGKSISEAKKILAQQSEVAEFKVETNNPKRQTLPRFAFQIKVVCPAQPKNRLSH